MTKMQTFSFDEEEMLVLRTVLGFFTRISDGEQPYLDAIATQILDKIGNEETLTDEADNSKFAKKWYKQHDTCDICNNWFLKKELNSDNFCKECQKEIKDA